MDTDMNMNIEKKIVVVALGGNAILRPGQRGTAEEQFANVEITCRQLAQMVTSGKYKIVVTHGNGPQVGNILLQNELARRTIAPMPLDVCGAQSQGLIGYMIAQTLNRVLAQAGRGDIPIACVVTQVVVDRDDPAFQNPTKPVGPFYTEEEARKLAAEKGYRLREDAGRGFRRVVPSPDPLSIHEKAAIKQLLDARTIVIAAGGGGIPVIREDGGLGLRGVEAVIDKDLAAERLAEDVGAKVLLILTDVEKVMLNYGQPHQEALDRLTAEEAQWYMEEGHFAPGSMAPKITAALRFVRSGGEKAVISSLSKALDALEGRAGTTITLC